MEPTNWFMMGLTTGFTIPLIAMSIARWQRRKDSGSQAIHITSAEPVPRTPIPQPQIDQAWVEETIRKTSQATADAIWNTPIGSSLKPIPPPTVEYRKGDWPIAIKKQET